MLALALLPSLMTACVLGSESDPGCRDSHPEDCENGWSCRGGVCVRSTTTLSPPADAATDGANALIDGPTEEHEEGGDDGGDAEEQG